MRHTQHNADVVRTTERDEVECQVGAMPITQNDDWLLLSDVREAGQHHIPEVVDAYVVAHAPFGVAGEAC